MANDRSTTTLDPATGSSTGMASTEHPLAETGKEAGQKAGHLIERTADIGIQQADRGLNQAADGVETVAQTIRRVSTDMETEQPQVADFALTAADRAEDLARYLRETDVRQIIGNVESFARRQPLLFLGGAFVLGMAASRFIKAAGGSQSQLQGYGQGHASGYGTNYQSGATSDFRTSSAYEATGPGTRNGFETGGTSEGI